MANRDKDRFAVIVRFDGENPDNQYPPLVYTHRSPTAAARRLMALINRRAAWVPKCVAVGTRFYITDRGVPVSEQRVGVSYPQAYKQYSHTQFVEAFL